MHRNSFTEDYEFEVQKKDGYGDGVFGYSVSLPHQCDEWEIIGAEVDNQDIPHNNYNYPSHPTSKELAINQMELFIKRANEALEKLKML